MSLPGVGIVIPAYNPGPHLRRALDSVVAQTHTGWTCVVIDDGGEEDLAWVDGYHPRVIRHRHANVGVSAARNNALTHLDTELVAYLDQDDEWAPDKLAQQLSHLGADHDFSWTGFSWQWPDRELEADACDYDYPYFLDDGHICLSSLLIRRDRLIQVGGFNPLLRVQQDFELVLRLFAAGASAAPVHRNLVRYHLHDANVSADYRAGHRERVTVLQLHLDAARGAGQARIAAAARAGMRRARGTYGAQAFDAFRRTRAPTHLVWALRLSPRYVLLSLARAAWSRRPSAAT